MDQTPDMARRMVSQKTIYLTPFPSRSPAAELDHQMMLKARMARLHE